jgi:hypothetical protein
MCPVPVWDRRRRKSPSPRGSSRSIPGRHSQPARRRLWVSAVVRPGAVRNRRPIHPRRSDRTVPAPALRHRPALRHDDAGFLGSLFDHRYGPCYGFASARFGKLATPGTPRGGQRETQHRGPRRSKHPGLPLRRPRFPLPRAPFPRQPSRRHRQHRPLPAATAAACSTSTRSRSSSSKPTRATATPRLRLPPGRRVPNHPAPPT